MKDYLIVSFGGPRSLEEIAPFLEELLTDRDVIRTKLPRFLNEWLFRRVARKRAVEIRGDYERIGGKSPIYFDTELLAKALGEKLRASALTFHRYLPATHEESLRRIEACQGDEISVFPLFPQFSFGTTGSIARFFEERLSRKTRDKLRWIRSFAAHPAFVDGYQRRIRETLEQHGFLEEETILLFSAHGVPQNFIDEGDPYQTDCEASFRKVSEEFPKALKRLSYQSKFGKGEWIKPYTLEVCASILDWSGERKNVALVPIAFTSDHIETLFEVEEQYIPLIRAKGLRAVRCPALGLAPYWVEGMAQIFQDAPTYPNKDLIRYS
jgi:ferrochelatase